MKMYATTTSERATKGQGGNEYLIIRLYNSENKLHGCIIETEKDGITGYISIDNEKMNIKAVNPLKVESFSNFLEKEKGEKKKDEICRQCARIHKYHTAICI